MNFQKKVIIFFVVLLLIIMIFLGVTMSNNKATNIPWPPIISSCPDYWTDTPDEPPEEFVTTCSETSIYATVDSSGNSTELLMLSGYHISACLYSGTALGGNSPLWIWFKNCPQAWICICCSSLVTYCVCR